MAESPVPELQYPCVFTINRAWQLAIGRLQARRYDLREVAAVFATVPRPRSFTGAALAAQTLNTFFLDFGRAYDRQFHTVVQCAHCTFDCDHCYAYVRVTPDTWNTIDIAAIVCRWSNAFGAAFMAAHGRDIVALSTEWFAADSIGHVAHDLGRSPATFRRHFKGKTGMRPIDGRTRARVIEAFVLLRTTAWKVDAIARKVGWNSPKAIYEAFDALLQMTPKTVRLLSEADAATTFARLGGDGTRLSPSRHPEPEQIEHLRHPAVTERNRQPS